MVQNKNVLEDDKAREKIQKKIRHQNHKESEKTDIKNITAPMLSTGIVRDFLQASGRVLIHTPNIITTMAKTCTMRMLSTCSTHSSE